MNNSEEMTKTGFAQELVLIQTKPNQIGETYIVVGILKADNGKELVLERVSSPTIEATSTIHFQQHMLPMTLLDAECMDNILTVIQKDYITFHAIFRLDDPHPLCEEYLRYWGMKEDPEEVDDPE